MLCKPTAKGRARGVTQGKYLWFSALPHFSRTEDEFQAMEESPKQTELRRGQITPVWRELHGVHRAAWVWARMRPLLWPRASTACSCWEDWASLGLNSSSKKGFLERGVDVQTSRAEQAHNSRHLCLGTSHVRSVPLTLTTWFCQPRAGHATDGAVLAKPTSRKAALHQQRGNFC